MSIRTFHIIFLAATLFLFGFISYWNYLSWIDSKNSASLLYIFMSLIFGLLIGYYGIKFYDKTKGLSG